jgi:Papain family cysteine protease.
MLAQQETISVRQVFDRDTTLALFNTRNQISKLAVNVSLTKKTPKFFARIVLEDQNHRNYLVGEAYREIADENTFSLFDCSEETELLNGIVPYRLKIYLKDASVELNTINIVTGTPERGINEENLRVEKIQEKVNKINAYNNCHQKLWAAGITELSKAPFEDRMRALGFDESDNTGGFEYYIGGIFEVSEREDYVPNRSRDNQFVDEFDWTDRHGKNWMTDIRKQYHSNYCQAFATLGSVEALINLYYNTKIDLDLSEQEIACCSYTDNPNRNPYIRGVLDTWAYKYLKLTGVCEENAYPFVDDSTRTICMSDTAHPVINVKIAGHSIVYHFLDSVSHYEDSIKRNLINYGPLVSGLSVKIDSTNNNQNRLHAMTLVGYGTIHAGDIIREVLENNHTNNNSTYTNYYVIPDTSSLIGRTYFKFKNSNNIRVNDDIDGYMYLMFHDMSRLSCMNMPVRLHYPFTITNCQTNQPMYTDSDIVCEDADGDGYYFWGLGTRPSSCPSSAPTDPDGDDSDPTVGPMDEYGNLTTLTNEIVISSLVNYSSVMNFTHNIRIVNGGHLRITNTTTLRNAAQITVENGGLLTIDGGTLNNAKIVFYSGATLNVINGGTINMAKNQDFNAPVGVVVNITEGQVNNF